MARTTKAAVESTTATAEANRFEPLMRSRDQRLADGAALRDAVPRRSHTDWKRPAKRRDPIDILKESSHWLVA